jgi:hypothetical protein
LRGISSLKGARVFKGVISLQGNFLRMRLLMGLSLEHRQLSEYPKPAYPARLSHGREAIKRVAFAGPIKLEIVCPERNYNATWERLL